MDEVIHEYGSYILAAIFGGLVILGFTMLLIHGMFGQVVGRWLDRIM